MSIKFYAGPYRPQRQIRVSLYWPHKAAVAACAVCLLVLFLGGSLWWLAPATAAGFLAAAIEWVFIGPHEMDRRRRSAELAALEEVCSSRNVVDSIVAGQLIDCHYALEDFNREELYRKHPHLRGWRGRGIAADGTAVMFYLHGLIRRDVQ